ncbi:hypothetical protein BC831DRAFT_388859, partial [Entophlyctis helioformis]
ATLLALVAAASSVSAHYSLIRPPARGKDDLISDQAPCGGYNDVGPRTTVDQKSSVDLSMADAGAACTINFGAGGNPTSFPNRIGAQSFTARGVFTIPIDLAGFSGPGTIQTVCTSSHGVLYQCTDVTV